MAKTPAHFALYPSDWLAGTRGMTAAETGVYTTLIMMMYERGEPLQMDRPRLARLCGIPAGSFSRVLASLIADGKLIEGAADGALWNERVGKELAISLQKSGAAKAAADTRWQSDGRENAKVTMHSEKQISDAYTAENGSENNGQPMRTQCERNANQNQNQNQKERDLTLSGSGLSDPQIPDPITPPPKPKASKPDGPPKARMPDGWRPMPDQIESALAEGIPEDRMEDEIYDFIEYWQGVKAAHGRKSDRGWGVAWRNNVARVVGLRYRGGSGNSFRDGAGGSAGSQVPGRGGPASRAAAAGVRYLNRHHGGQ
jgi:uncharacterized protein YdaU (DUF1376 family)